MDMQGRNQRLPSLEELLSRRSQAPVDLFNFYIYMRDTARSVDYLDLWLDISQHTSLCRLYIRELRRSLLNNTPEQEQALNAAPSGSRSTSYSTPSELDSASEKSYAALYSGPGAAADGENNPRLSQIASGVPADARPADSGGRAPMATNMTPQQQVNKRVSELSSAPSTGAPGSVEHSVQRQDITASAERILYTYMVPGAEREVALPHVLVDAVRACIEQDGRDDPEVFDDVRGYVFQAIEHSAYPKFLRAKALGNLVAPSALLRLIFGIFCIFGGLWIGFVLIFLNYAPQVTRLWVLLLFALGVYALVSFEFHLDPLLGLVGLSETTFLRFMRIREPYVRQLLVTRSLWVLSLFAVVTAGLTLLFVLVPGKRL